MRHALIYLTILVCGIQTFAQNSNSNFAAESAVDSVVTILLMTNGEASAIGSGLIVRSDGYILIPISLTDASREIRVRLRNGEIYDNAKIVATDERRKVAILRINATGLRTIPNGTIEESQVGTKVFVIGNPFGESWVKTTVLNSVQLADNINGAGQGYRVLQLNNVERERRIGGLVLDESGRSLGIINTNEVIGQDIAVPLSSLLGLIRSTYSNTSFTNSPVYSSPSPQPTNTPFPIPQNSVQVPQRGVTQLSAKGPGSVVLKPVTAKEILAVSKTVYVTSRTVFFKPDQMVNALKNRSEFNDWGLTFVEERELADLILELDHLLFTYKFSFKLYSERSGTIIATGDKIIFDGNLGAPYMAKRVIEKLEKVRAANK